MQAVLAPPVGERRQRDEAAQSPGQPVGPARREERAVAAIVLDDEDADQKGTRRHGEGKSQWIRDREDEIHRHARGDEWTERSQELQHALLTDRLCKGGCRPAYLGHRAGRNPVLVHEEVPSRE
jgi:hypothetical protein